MIFDVIKELIQNNKLIYIIIVLIVTTVITLFFDRFKEKEPKNPKQRARKGILIFCGTFFIAAIPYGLSYLEEPLQPSSTESNQVIVETALRDIETIIDSTPETPGTANSSAQPIKTPNPGEISGPFNDDIPFREDELLFSKRELVISAPTMDYTEKEYWDSTKIKTINWKYDYELIAGEIASFSVSAFYNTNIGYFLWEASGDETYDLSKHWSTRICSPFDSIDSEGYFPILHEAVVQEAGTDIHYHSDHYFLVTEDVNNKMIVDYIHIFWMVNRSDEPEYDYIIIKDEEWGENASTKSNDFIDNFYETHNLNISDYSAPSHYYVTKEGIENARNYAMEFAQSGSGRTVDRKLPVTVYQQ